MNTSNFYKYLSILLLILNIAALSFIFLGRKGHLMNKGAAHMLQLNTDQQELFDASAIKHHESIQTINSKHAETLKTYFETLTGNELITLKDSLLTEINTLEKSKLEITYNHFKEIKSLLNEDQLPEFDNFMEHMLRRILPKKGDMKKR